MNPNSSEVGRALGNSANFAGRYTCGGPEAGARVDVFVTGPRTIRVVGRAYRGSSRPLGPNIGLVDLDGSSDEVGVYNVGDANPGADGQFRMRLEFFADGLRISEENSHGYLGMNVSFEGVYRRLGDAKWPHKLPTEDI